MFCKSLNLLPSRLSITGQAQFTSLYNRRRLYSIETVVKRHENGTSGAGNNQKEDRGRRKREGVRGKSYFSEALSHVNEKQQCL